MKINKKQLELKMAVSCLNPFQLAEDAKIQYQTLRRAINGGNCKPATVGRIAAALGVDVTEIIEQGEQ